MSTTTAPEQQRTLFATEDNQTVHEIGERGNTYVVGTLVLTNARLAKRNGRWTLRGTIPIKIAHR